MNDASDITNSSRIGPIGGFGHLREDLLEIGVEQFRLLAIAYSTILCDLRPLMSAMKPTPPQGSFSRLGSPWLRAIFVQIMGGQGW
jgi:hypothetical protein